MEAAETATLGRITGRGFLALRTHGYRRVEGVFFAAQPTHSELVDLFVAGEPIEYRGTLYLSEKKKMECVSKVVIRAVTRESGRTRVEIEREGSTAEVEADVVAI